MKKLKDKRIYKYLLFSVCYWIIIGPLMYRSFSGGWTAFGTSDAIVQIYPVMLYVSRLLKSFFSAVFTGKTFTFPMVEYTLGMGDDVIATLNWHGFGDPFYLLTAFVPEQYMPYCYGFLFYLRVFVGGLAFIAFVYEVNGTKSNHAYVVGAVAYCLTGFTAQSNMHTIFTHAIVYIPLMLLGAERSFNKKKRGVLTTTVFLFALSGYFFLWIGSVTLAVYVIYRSIRRKQTILDTFKMIGKLLVEYLLGLGLASVIFIPAVWAFLHGMRSEFVLSLDAFRPMSLEKIGQLLFSSFLPSYQEGQELAVCTIGIVFVIWILLKKQNNKEKINIGLIFLTAIFPAVSCLMSGFGGFYPRWELIIDLYITFLIVELWDEFKDIELIPKLGISILYLGLLLIGKRCDLLSDEKFRVTFINYSIILLIVWCLFPVCKKIRQEKAGAYITFFVILYTIGNCWWATARDMPITYVQERDVISELDCRDDLYRVDYEKSFMEPRLGMNVSFILQYKGISEYFSIENLSYLKAFEKWGMFTANHNNSGMDQRTVLETISSVKYFIARPESKSIVPYGFTKIKSTEDGEWDLYENQYAMPLIYTYNSVFDESKYLEMNGIERQDVMMQSASVENYDGSIQKENDIKCHISYNDFQIVDIANGDEKEGVVEGTSDTQIKLSITLRSGGENYLYVDGKAGKHISCVEIEDGYTKYYRGADSQVVNLGCVDEDVQKIVTVTLNKTCQFEVSAIQSVFFDFSDYAACRAERGKDVLPENIKISTNQVACDVQLEDSKIMCIALPYSEGWKAYIDNEDVKIYRINDMFMAIEVPEGTHHIELHYTTPGIVAGLCICIICAVSIFAYIIGEKRQDGDKR